jgi:diguanylate cyclase (GGDEF)-like protein
MVGAFAICLPGRAKSAIRELCRALFPTKRPGTDFVPRAKVLIEESLVVMGLTRFDAAARHAIGVANPDRLTAVANAELRGHLGDPDLNAIVETLRLACRVPIAFINIVTENLQTYPAEVGIGAACTSVPDAVSFCSEVVNTGRDLSIADVTTHPVYAQNPLVLSGAVRAYAGVPLIDDDAVVGSLSIFDDQVRTFSNDDLALLRHLSRLATSVLALRRTARTDALTGLPNREVFFDRVERALARADRNGAMVCVMYFDVDDFKRINDTYGHDAGDQVLVELGRRVHSLLRLADTLARIGGDEFVILYEDLHDVASAQRLATRLLESMKAPWLVDGEALTISVSVGVAVAESAPTSYREMLKHADAALYEAKRSPGSLSVKVLPTIGAQPTRSSDVKS